MADARADRHQFQPQLHRGVSATAAGVIRQQVGRYDMALAGVALPGCPDPVDHG